MANYEDMANVPRDNCGNPIQPQKTFQLTWYEKLSRSNPENKFSHLLKLQQEVVCSKIFLALRIDLYLFRSRRTSKQ